MTLIRVGKYVINTDHILYIDLSDYKGTSERDVVVYLKGFEGEIFTGELEIAEVSKQLRTGKITFTGDDAKALKRYLSDSKNVTIISEKYDEQGFG